jgi:hydroxyquinol 1,2-dioxygenase
VTLSREEHAMPELNEQNITDEVLKTLAKTPDPRLKEIMTVLIKHLHEFGREARLTPGEWIQAIGFLTAVGQKCTPHRQEFILLSDTLGFSALVNLMYSKAAAGGTPTSLLGPFFRENAPELKSGDSIAEGDPASPILLTGQVVDEQGKPVADALIDAWQTSSTGLYDIQGPNPEEMSYRGRFRTDKNGRYEIETVVPLGYSIPTDGPVGKMFDALKRHPMRPAHIHMLIAAEGYRELATALYIAGDKHIDSDAVFGVSSSLVVTVEKPPATDKTGIGRITYDFRLTRPKPGETSVRVGADPSKVMAAE